MYSICNGFEQKCTWSHTIIYFWFGIHNVCCGITFSWQLCYMTIMGNQFYSCGKYGLSYILVILTTCFKVWGCLVWMVFRYRGKQYNRILVVEIGSRDNQNCTEALNFVKRLSRTGSPLQLLPLVLLNNLSSTVVHHRFTFPLKFHLVTIQSTI